MLWVARLWGAAVLIVFLIAVVRMIQGGPNTVVDYKLIALYTGSITGLLMAYKWPVIGGMIAILGIVISGFWHPLIFIPGFLFLGYGLLSRQFNREVPVS